MLTGYNGVDFCGSQKNENVRTVEEEMEKALYKLGMISKFNLGDLKKIGWSRATRTDKKVHALINTFSAKVLVPKRPTITTTDPETGEKVTKSYTIEEHLEDMRVKLNSEALPNDVRIFSMFTVANRFNAKNCTNYREYSYFLPTFMLTNIDELYLATPPRVATEEEKKESEKKQRVVTSISSGVKKIVRSAGIEDEHEKDQEACVDANRPINHISDEKLARMYSTRLPEEQKTTLHELWGNFKGTKRYHNFTKEIKPHEAAAMRYMMEMTANEFMYVNQDTFAVTEESDPKAIEFVRFYLKGQSFLFNQIRKMVGAMVQVYHGKLGLEFIERTHLWNALHVALSPGDGLLLERVAYD